MKNAFCKNLIVFLGVILPLAFILCSSEQVNANSYDGEDLATAILANPSTLISSSYFDRDNEGHRQGIVLSSLGTMIPTNGSTFALISTGIAGAVPVTTNALDPGSERGTWFKNKYGNPRDEATLTMTLEVPSYMHYLYYDIQFFTAEYPDYIGTQYNDKFIVTVVSPSEGTTSYTIDVNGGDFVLNAHDIAGTGYDVFAQSGDPDDVDWLTTTPNPTGADAGASALIGREHPVSPNEQITVTFNIKDAGDNQFDSSAFIDNLKFSGFAKTDLIARKSGEDINGGFLECGDIIKYTTTISNIGTAKQMNNPGNEFEDSIPENTTYVVGSSTATSGLIEYNEEEDKITWNGEIPGESSVVLTFQVMINTGLTNNTIISNQGKVYWDSNENGTNDMTELTDDLSSDDGIDQDGDGETDDDDPTTMAVIVFQSISILAEDFSDDSPGENAKQFYYIAKWFETTNGTAESNFEVVSSYHYSTIQSFKTKIRTSSGVHLWKYNLSKFNNSRVKWWEVWFACGNTSEESDLFLNFTDGECNDVAKLKLEYIQDGLDKPSDYVLRLYYRSSSGWIQLASDFLGGYLYNGWYKIKIEKYGENYINYSLYQAGKGLVESKTDNILETSLLNLAQVEWSSTKNPVVCPIFFWDEHRIGLTSIS